ncbi:MAG: SDR family oxidoreductase [Myxococcales bacterium]|nr:SDR family oxidoreductase [Myxococcales bacterium]
MARRAVVTGGAGFIGSSLCERLVADGWQVLALDNFCTGRRLNLASLEGHPAFELRSHDVCDPIDIDGPVDAVLHFASPASPFDYLTLPVETLRVGSVATMHLLELARRKGARFLIASTSEIYGDPLEHPQRENYFGNVNSIGPRSVYDEAKRFAEAATMAWHRKHGVDTRIIRIFNTYGPRMKAGDGRVVPAFLSQALRGEALTVFGDGSQTRSFCFVDDLVDGVVRVLERGDAQPYNLGNPAEFTMLELVREIEKLMGTVQCVHMPLPIDDPTRRKPDIARAIGELGWSPLVPLSVGLRRTADGFRTRMAAGQHSAQSGAGG